MAPLEEIFKIIPPLINHPTTTFAMIAFFYPVELISDDSSSDTEDVLTY